MKLSSEGYRNAKSFMNNHARDLERTLFEYEFEKGTKEAVLKALKVYQNTDGGFGHGIEADVRMPESCPFSTTIAFQILSQLKVNDEHDLVRNGIKYFLNTYDDNIGRWRAVSKEVNDAPHAPWWHFEEDGFCGVDRDCWGNPTAEIISYLIEYNKWVPNDFLELMIQRSIEKLEAYPDDIEMHELLCFIRLAERLSGSNAKSMIEKLKRSIPNVIGLTLESWKKYSATPLSFIYSPSSPYYDAIDKEILDLNLKYEIDNQNEDGSWSPNWRWGQYEEAWLISKQEWSGVLTLKALKILKSFDGIDMSKE